MYLTFRDLLACGETWVEAARAGEPIDNLPQQPRTIEALRRLCKLVLDPVISEFGSVELTYAHSGRELSNRIKRTVGRIAPRLDQHASHELNSRGAPICNRGGAAADFKVVGVSSLELATWVVRSTDFDRLFYYGDNRPIHVSAAAHPIAQIVELRMSHSGRRTPVVRSRESFLSGK